MLLAATSTQIWVTAGSSLALGEADGGPNLGCKRFAEPNHLWPCSCWQSGNNSSRELSCQKHCSGNRVGYEAGHTTFKKTISYQTICNLVFVNATNGVRPCLAFDCSAHLQLTCIVVLEIRWHGADVHWPLILWALQEAPETFNIVSEDRPRRRRINTLRKEQETGSSGYRRVPPEPLEMQARREEPDESE